MRSSRPLTFLAAALGLALAGCATGGSSHYVKSARLRLAAPPTIPALNLSDGDEKPLMAVRLGYSGPARGAVTTRVDTLSAQDTTALDRDRYYAAPGRYDIERDRLTVGVDFQTAINRVVDFFATVEAAPSLQGRVSGHAGVGLTVPLPWLGVRFAPALEAHRYHLRVVDSTDEYFKSGDELTVDGDLVTDDRHRIGFGLGTSFSAWIPSAALGIPLTPFVQFQSYGLLIGSTTLSPSVLSLGAFAGTAGFDYELPWGHAQARLSRELMGADGWSRSWRLQTGLVFRLDDPDARDSK